MSATTYTHTIISPTQKVKKLHQSYKPKILSRPGFSSLFIKFMPKINFSKINFHKTQEQKRSLGFISNKRFYNKNLSIHSSLDFVTFNLSMANSIYHARRLVNEGYITINKNKAITKTQQIKPGSILRLKIL